MLIYEFQRYVHEMKHIVITISLIKITVLKINITSHLL
jgi:hypothetical protein